MRAQPLARPRACAALRSAARRPRCGASASAPPPPPHAASSAAREPAAVLCRRAALRAALLAGSAALAASPAPPAFAYATQRDDDKDFTTTPSGLRLLDLRPGAGEPPRKGDTVVVHWSGYTSGYQAKRIDNTSIRDEPYEFVLGSGTAIAAFDEAISGMRPGGIRRIEVPGEVPSLSYPIDRKERFTDEVVDEKLRIYRYRKGPQPAELGGQRALDFVLDNRTLQDFNRTLLFDIRLLSVRRRS